MGGNGKTTRYADLHSRKWCDFVLNKGKESGVRLEKFLSFQLPRTAALQESIKLDKSEKRVSHFAFNNAMSGALVGGYSWQGRGPVLVFECDLGWNGYGGFEDALKYAEINGLESIAVGFESNQVEMVAKEDLKNQDWDGTSRRLEKSAKGFWTIGEGEKNILNWRGRNVRDVLRCFGNPTSAKPFGENGGAWLYKGLGITNEDGESQDSVTFIVQNGIVRDVKLKPSKLTPLP